MSLLKKVYWTFLQFGVDPRRFVNGWQELPHFLKDYRKFRSGYSGEINWKPCLHDRNEEGGTANSEYFWQDLIVARSIFLQNPLKHVDIGSRIDGFVAHVASFREVEVFDIRAVTAIIPGITFRQADVMNRNSLPGYEGGYCDALSCLHTIEHFGLGRYGDPLNPNGYALGIANMAALLKPTGIFYLSTPIGRERVEFNANRVFNPSNIISVAKDNKLILSKLTTISKNGKVIETNISDKELEVLSGSEYHLGVFEFIKQ